MTLCVYQDCASISHLRCLAASFLKHEQSSSMVPRGGECPSCGEWTLWGDLIRGCYRRKTGAVSAVAKEAEDLSEDEEGSSEEEEESEGDLGMRKLSLAPSDDEPPSPVKVKGKKAVKSPTVSPRRGRPPKEPATPVSPRPRGRPKGTTLAKPRKKAAKATTHNSGSESSEMIDITGVR